jgi:molybdopterin-guanine dinucleotide biosynthesis protein A
MGRDKARLPVEGRPLLLKLLEVGRSACREGILVVDRPGRYDDLLSGWASTGWPLRVAVDLRGGRGPVAGLEAGLAAATEAACFVAACDLPYLEPSLVTALLAEIEVDPRPATGGGAKGAESGGEEGSGMPRAIVPVRGGRDQPLCAAYERRAVGAAASCLDAGEDAVAAFLDRLLVRRLEEDALDRLVGRVGASAWTVDLDRPGDAAGSKSGR